MQTQNLYWPVYKNLEKEFQKLADYIHFSDDQLEIYSMFIADLIVRCSIEIESISKDLYYMLGGNMFPTTPDGEPRNLFFDTDCLDLLEKKWALGKKQISISAINFYFIDNQNITLTPLYKSNKRGTSGSKWKQAYQAIKHDRKNSLKKATIKNLLHALGSLYILNLYYRDERNDIGRAYLSERSFDNRAGSEIFSAYYCKATGLLMNITMNDSCISPSLDDELYKSIYIIKYDDKSFKEMHKNYCLDNKITMERFKKSPEIKIFLDNHPEYCQKSVNEICMAAGGTDLLRRIFCFQHAMKEKGTRMEVILNKHSGIYPELLPEE